MSIKSNDEAKTRVVGSRGVLESLWAKQLSSELRRRVTDETVIKQINPGGYVCQKGEKARHWFGVIEGLVKVSSISTQGKALSFIGVPAGGWFGEGALLKDELRLYDAIALRDSIVAYMPRNTFMLLLDTSVAFNRFLVMQLNERLGQFVAMVEHDRSLGPEARLATELASLFNPLLYPGHRMSIPISQEELAHLIGLSRQRVNSALKNLHQAGLIKINYRGVTILDNERLRRWGQ